MTIREDITKPTRISSGAMSSKSRVGPTGIGTGTNTEQVSFAATDLDSSGGLSLLSLNAVFALTEQSVVLKKSLPSQVHRIMVHIDGKRTVAQVLKTSPYSIERTMQVIRRLHSLGVIEALNKSVLLQKTKTRDEPTRPLKRMKDGTSAKAKTKSIHQVQTRKFSKQGLNSGRLAKKDGHVIQDIKTPLTKTALETTAAQRSSLQVEEQKPFGKESSVSGIFDEILKDKPTLQTRYSTQSLKTSSDSSLSTKSQAFVKSSSNKDVSSQVDNTQRAEDSFIDLSIEDIEQIVVDSFMTPMASGLVESNTTSAGNAKWGGMKSEDSTQAVYTPLDENDIIGIEPDTLPDKEGTIQKLVVKEFNQKNITKADVAPDLKDEPSIIVDEDSLAPEDISVADGHVENTEERTDPSLEFDIEFSEAEHIVKEESIKADVQVEKKNQGKSNVPVFTKSEEAFFEKAEAKIKMSDFNFEDLDKDSKLPMTFWERLKQKRS